MTARGSLGLLTMGGLLVALSVAVGLVGHVLGQRMVSGMPASTLAESVFLLFCAAPVILISGITMSVVAIVRRAR